MDTSTVYIFNTYEARPTYHDYGKIDRKRDADVTACGRVMYDGRVRYNAVLRRDHAVCFAKPCSKCFRGEDD